MTGASPLPSPCWARGLLPLPPVPEFPLVLEQGIAGRFYGAVSFDAAAELEKCGEENEKARGPENAILHQAGLPSKRVERGEHEICGGKQ
jgi:hypothetical protein